MIENITAVKRTLLEAIEKKIGEMGFRKNLGRQSLVKNTDFGKYIFHIAFINHISDVDVVADVAIRHDVLENLFDENEIRPYLDEKQRKDMSSFGAEFGILSCGNQKRWTIKSMLDIEETANLIVEDFYSVGLPYLYKYSDLQTAFIAILNGGKEAKLLHPFPVDLAMKGLGLAFILGEKEAFYRIADEKEKYLTPINNSGIETFLELKEKLESKL